MRTRLVTPPAIEPVSLLDAKLHCRVESDFEDEDTLFEGLIRSAREYAEGFQNRAYITQTWQLVLDHWPSGKVIRLPLPPLQSATITYKPEGWTTGDPEETLADIIVDTNQGLVVLAEDRWPEGELYTHGAITVEFVAGYGDEADDVPMTVRQAMLLLIGHWYANRESVVVGQQSSTLPQAVESLLWLDRVVPA